ncbi:MAG: peptidylprolyl isomerase [Planctomycetes bacterium]|nr:peptidylprolyl isomerase [Planctomycetota bacterium]
MRFLLGLTCIVVLSVALWGCKKEEPSQQPIATPAVEPTAEPAAQADVDNVVVTVNGQPITEDLVAPEVSKRVEIMNKRAPEGQPLSDIQKDMLRKGVVDMLVQQMTMNQLAEKWDVSVSDDRVMEEIGKIATQQGQTLEEVQAEIGEYGMTMDDLRQQVRPQILMTEVAEACQKDEAMVAEAKKFYDENSTYFEKPEQVRASHILIKSDAAAGEEVKAATKAKAEEVLAKAKAGEDFAALAKEYSEDPGSKDNGGEYTFPRGQMVKPFEDTAFGMEVGAISDLVETQFGYHIIKLSEKMEAEKVPFEEAQKDIISFLLQKQLKENVKVEYSAQEQALRDKTDQQQMMQQQMMQQIQAQMAQQQAQQATQESSTETAEAPVPEVEVPAATETPAEE